MTHPPRAAILDVDGTLVDSNDAHAHAWAQALTEAGVDAPFERIRPLIGMGGDKILDSVAGVSKDSREGKALSARRKELFERDHLPGLRAFPDVRALLERMRAGGLELAVASSASPEELGPLLDLAGVQDLLASRTSSGDAERSKPDPDIVRAALTRLGMPAAQVCMLGDTPYDVEAAARAGIGTVALRCGGWQDADLKGALAIYDDPADLLRHYADSPFARP